MKLCLDFRPYLGKFILVFFIIYCYTLCHTDEEHKEHPNVVKRIFFGMSYAIFTTSLIVCFHISHY